MIYQELPDIKGKIKFDYPMAATSWFGVGGNADAMFKPHDTDDLAHFIRNKPSGLDYLCLGLCSNVIIRDGGYRGILIKLGRNFNYIDYDIANAQLNVGAGVSDYNLSLFALENSLEGFEFLSGIPGGIGGALAMNAGAYDRQISDILLNAKAVNEVGEIIEINNKDFGFSYRKNSLKQNLIFVEATFKAIKGEQNQIKEKFNFIKTSRETTQPIKEKTGGSTFKNPQYDINGNKIDLKAWQIIDKLGFRGFKHGGAMMSDKHCNFMINYNNATAKNLEDLGNMIIEKAKKDLNIELEWEIKRIGEYK